MNGLVGIGVALAVLWAVLWLGFKVVSGVVHLLVIVALALIVVGIVRRGVRSVTTR